MAMQLHGLFAIVVLLLLGTTDGQKYNLTKAVQSSLVQSHDRPSSVCNVPGVCVPVNQTIEARSMWYWCGFMSTHRTQYTVTSTSSTANLTNMFLMRREQVEGCALNNVTWVGDRCLTVPDSSCSGKKTCDIRVFGLVFPDDVCLVIINNKGSNIVAKVQAWNYFDRPRYYGTCFVLMFTVAGSLAILANVGYQVYTII
ncbi:hypothetical protein Agub_g97, partial [Astrephomene gubernaculifera]